MSYAKTAAPIEMPFGMLNRVSQGNHVLHGGADAPMGRGTFRGVYGPSQRIWFWGLGKRVSCAKMGGPILTICTSLTCFYATRCLLGITIRLLPM